jgi:hypothetical protein
MATKFYFKYIPGRRGLTGVEYLPQWLEENHPTITFNSIISDGIANFGVLEGSGEELPKAISAIEGRFSCARITEDVMIGIITKFYDPQPMDDMDGETPPTLDEFLASYGLSTPADKLPNIKERKRELLKEIAKKKFSNLNDTTADLCKIVTLLNLHSPDLTSEEQTQVDNISTTLKGIYDKALCIAAYDRMVGELSNVLTPYYTAMTSVENATTEEEIDAVVYE